MNHTRTRRGLAVLVVLLVGLSLVAPGAASPVDGETTDGSSVGGGLTDSSNSNTTDDSENSTSTSSSDSSGNESLSGSDSGSETSSSDSSSSSSDTNSSDSWGSDSSDSNSSSSFGSDSSDSDSSDSWGSDSNSSDSSSSFDSDSSDSGSSDADSSETNSSETPVENVSSAASDDRLLAESMAELSDESTSQVTSLDDETDLVGVDTATSSPETVYQLELLDVGEDAVLELTARDGPSTAATTVSDTVSTSDDQFSGGASGTTEADGDAARVKSTGPSDGPTAPVDGERDATGAGGADTDGDAPPRNAVGLSGSPEDLPGSPVGAGAILGAIGVGAAVVTRQSTALSGVAGGLSTSVGTAASSVPGSSHLDRLVRSLAPFRYSRYDDSDPLEHDAREEMFAVVEDSPGTYLSEIAERADIPLSTARHHIRVLEREDLVSGAKVRGKRRFYPAHTEGVELAAAMNDDSTAAVIDALARLGAASVSDLADELGKDPSTVTHHVQRLEEDEVVVRERDGRAVMNKLSPAARTMLEPEGQHAEGPAAGEAMASD